MKVSVIIPNYNTWDLVKRNIDKLLKYDKSYISEIIVVDDASPQKNPYLFDPIVKIIRNGTNLHYSATVNNGLKSALNEIVVVLDSDAYPTHPFLSKVIDQFNTRSSLGCIGFKTVNEEGEDTGNTANEPTIFSLLLGQQLTKFLKPLDFRRKNYIIPFSCAVAFRKQAIEEENYLDEAIFPILMADYDLCIRLNKKGYFTVYDQSIIIFHKGGESIPRNYKRVILFYNARWQFLKKHQGLKFIKIYKAIILTRFRLEYFYLKLHPAKSTKNLDLAEGRKQIIASIKQLK